MHGRTGGPLSRLLASRSPVPRDFYRSSTKDLMPKPRFTLRTFFIFTSVLACVGSLNRIAWPEYALYNFIRPLPDHQCFKLPYVVEFGLPLTAFTNNHAEHPPHETGPCRFNTTWHPFGILVNTLFALICSAVATAGFVIVPRFVDWQIQLAHERKVIDAATSDHHSGIQ